MGRRPTKTDDWPGFDAPILQDIATAFQRRRKSLRYQAGLVCGREFSESADGTFERLNLNLPRSGLRLSVWADGELWVSVCVAAPGRNAGWAFQDTFHGNARDVTGASLVGMVEATLRLRLGTDPIAQRSQLRSIWQSVQPFTDTKR